MSFHGIQSHLSPQGSHILNDYDDDTDDDYDHKNDRYLHGLPWKDNKATHSAARKGSNRKTLRQLEVSGGRVVIGSPFIRPLPRYTSCSLSVFLFDPFRVALRALGCFFVLTSFVLHFEFS